MTEIFYLVRRLPNKKYKHQLLFSNEAVQQALKQRWKCIDHIRIKNALIIRRAKMTKQQINEIYPPEETHNE